MAKCLGQRGPETSCVPRISRASDTKGSGGHDTPVLMKAAATAEPDSRHCSAAPQGRRGSRLSTSNQRKTPAIGQQILTSLFRIKLLSAVQDVNLLTKSCLLHCQNCQQCNSNMFVSVQVSFQTAGHSFPVASCCQNSVRVTGLKVFLQTE